MPRPLRLTVRYVEDFELSRFRTARGQGEPWPYARGTKRTDRAALLKYVVIIEKGKNSFGAYVPDLPGCAVVGEPREEALQLLRQAVELHVSSLREEGSPVPEPASNTEYVQV